MPGGEAGYCAVVPGGGGGVKAHQRLIREQRAQQASDANLFGEWWHDLDTDIAKATVREVSRETAEKVILEYEWLGCMPAVVWYSYGIYFDGHLGGVVCYGPEYSENLGRQARERGRKCADWSRYGYEGKMILLSRGACVHWAHPHAGSKLIRASMKLLPERFEVVTATVDAAAGEVGTIYQAAGFVYVGSMREGNPKVKFRAKDREGWLIDGKIWGSRSIRAVCGTTEWATVQQYFPKAERVAQHSKGRYFAFRGSKRVQEQHRAAIAHLVQPYPKRLTPPEGDRTVE